MKNILLTGATGFLGSHMLKAILDATNYNVVVLKRSFSNTWRIKNELLSGRVKTHDIDKVGIEDIDAKGISVIIHCATEYGRRENSCLQILESNLVFPVKLLELAEKNKIDVFINTDSYFNKENLSYSHLLNYSLSKKSFNLWLKHFSKKIKVINMVLEHIYGEFDNSDKFTESMIQQIAIKKVTKVDLSPGDQKRDFVYVKDVCDAYIAAIKHAKSNNFRYRQFDIGTGKKTSLKDFVLAIKKIAGSPTVLNFGAVAYREDEIMCSVADISELSNLLVVDKVLDYKQGLEKVINTYRRRC